jgi:cell division cycle protein 20 (cofactor of APC complex)
MVVTGAGDESLKFWKIWDVPTADSKKGKMASGRGEGVTRSGVLSIR